MQPAAFGPPLRRALKAAEVDVDDLRAATAEAAGVDPPQLVRIRRLTWGTAIQLALVVLAVTTLIGAASGLDYGELQSTLDDALWGWVALGFVVAQLPRFAQALSTLGSVPARLPFFPVYVMQLATGYMNLALPSSLARMAVNIRFFQRQGIQPATAVTAGTIDSFVSMVAQALLLVLLLLFSSATLDFDLGSPSGPPTRALVAIVRAGSPGRRRPAGGAAHPPGAAGADRAVVAGGARDAREPPGGQQARPPDRRQRRGRDPLRDRARALRSRHGNADRARRSSC